MKNENGIYTGIYRFQMKTQYDNGLKQDMVETMNKFYIGKGEWSKFGQEEDV